LIFLIFLFLSLSLSFHQIEQVQDDEYLVKVLAGEQASNQIIQINPEVLAEPPSNPVVRFQDLEVAKSSSKSLSKDQASSSVAGKSVVFAHQEPPLLSFKNDDISYGVMK
jgi:hypothetical protein